MKKILFILITIVGFSCQNNIVYSHFETLPTIGWDANNKVTFTFDITDTEASYDILVYLRHTKKYPYQNVWFFIEDEKPNQTKEQDEIECYLSNQRGQWLGSGIGTYLEMPILYHSNIQFADTGSYSYHIQHGMREEILVGIHQLGLIVEKK